MLFRSRRTIAKGRGAHFDPDVVDAFLTHFDDFVRVARRYVDQPAEEGDAP